MASAFKNILKNYTLSYKVESGDSGDTDPVTGEIIPNKSDETITISFAPSKNDALIYSEGVELEEVAGIVTCLDPVRFPDGLNNGSEFDMTFNSVDGKLKLNQIIVDDLAFVETTLGQVAKATWQPLR